MAAVSANIDIVHAEPAITDLVFRQLTSEDIQRAQREEPDISRILAYKKYILLDVLLCSIAEYFYELCRILGSP